MLRAFRALRLIGKFKSLRLIVDSIAASIIQVSCTCTYTCPALGLMSLSVEVATAHSEVATALRSCQGSTELLRLYGLPSAFPFSLYLLTKP
jgi:hypothetical protein